MTDNISFSKNDISPFEFEIINLRSLFKRVHLLKHLIFKPHSCKFHIIIYIIGGDGSHCVDSNIYQLKDDSILFIAKGQTHKFDNSMSINGYMIMFTDDFLFNNLLASDILACHRLYNYHLYPSYIPVEKNLINIIRNHIDSIYMIYNEDDSCSKENIITVQLKLLLMYILRMNKHHIQLLSTTADFRRFITFKELVAENYMKTRNVSDYAKMLKVSYKYLNNLCKEFSGSTAKKILDDIIILEMKRSLSNENATINELTMQFGFDEPTNLIKYFKKHTSFTPCQFKNSLKHYFDNKQTAI